MLPLLLTGNETTVRMKNKMQASTPERIPHCVFFLFQQKGSVHQAAPLANRTQSAAALPQDF